MNLVKVLSNKVIVAVMLSALIAMGTLVTARVWPASAQTIGELDHVTVTQSNVSLAVGATQQFSAQAFDSGNNQISGLTYSWSVVNAGGTITDAGLFTAGTTAAAYANTVKVSVTQGEITKTGTASVTVTPGPLDHIVLSPATVTLAAGATQQYSSQGYDANNNSIAGLTYAGSVVNSGGTISAGGLFTAGQITGSFPDTVKVIATQGEITRTAYASVIVVAGTVTPTPTPTGTPAATPTPVPDNHDDHGDKGTGLHNKLWKWFAHRLGFRDVRSIDATVTDKDGTQHKVQIDDGIIASISGQSFTVTMSGATTTKSFATDADTKFRPAAREGKKGLEGFKVGDEVVVLTLDGKVTGVNLVHRPPTVDEQRTKLETKLQAQLDKHEEKGLKLEAKVQTKLDKFDAKHGHDGDDNDDDDNDDDDD